MHHMTPAKAKVNAFAFLMNAALAERMKSPTAKYYREIDAYWFRFAHRLRF